MSALNKFNPDGRTEQGSKTDAFSRLKAREEEKARANVNFDCKVSDEELLNFTQGFRDQLAGGIGFIEIFEQYQKNMPNKDFAAVMGHINNDLIKGVKIADAFAKFKKIFSDDYISLLEAAEISGNFTKRKKDDADGILDMIITYIRNRNNARNALISELIYPGILVTVIFIGIFVLSFVTMPALKEIIVSLNPKRGMNDVNLLTRTFFVVADYVQSYWWTIPVIIVGLIVAGVWFKKSGQLDEAWNKLQLRLPGVRSLYKDLIVGESFWLMSTLFSAGLTAQKTLEIVQKSVKNQEIKAALKTAIASIDNGKQFCESMKQCHEIFRNETYMILASAEKNGDLGPPLKAYAEQKFEKVERHVKRLTALVAPICLVIGGCIIGAMVIAFYSGIYEAVGNLTQGH